MSLIADLKDVLYITGSVFGIIGFIRTIAKREKSELNYKTELGNEVRPFLVCIRGDIYNLNISGSDASHEVQKLPIGFNISHYKYKKFDESIIDESCFFPVIKEGEILCVLNDKLKMPKIRLEYEDKYHNKYYQTFEFNDADIGNNDRIKRQSRSCYILSKRRIRFIWMWW